MFQPFDKKNASFRDIIFHELNANDAPVLFRISIDSELHLTASSPVAHKA